VTADGTGSLGAVGAIGGGAGTVALDMSDTENTITGSLAASITGAAVVTANGAVIVGATGQSTIQSLSGAADGAGGTQRLPRLAGPLVALEMVTSGRHVPADEAMSHGLVDKVATELLGAAAVALTGTDDAQIRAAMRHLQWGAGWLRSTAGATDPAAGQPDQPQVLAPHQILELLAATVEETSFRAAAQRVVTETAIRFGCDRFSLGLLRGTTMKIDAISHCAVVEARSGTTRLLADAMAEAVDQRALLRFPLTAEDAREPLARHAQEQLAAPSGAAILTIPLLQQDPAIGALLLERPGGRPLSGADIDRLDALAALVGPVLAEKWRDDRWVAAKVGESVVSQVRLPLGPTHVARELVLLAVVLFSVLAGTWHGEYPIIAEARLEDTIRRSIIAGLDGFLREAPVRAGDQLHAGELLAAQVALDRVRAASTAEIEAREAQLTLSRRQLERTQELYQHQVATAEHPDQLRAQNEINDRELRLARQAQEVTRLEL